MFNKTQQIVCLRFLWLFCEITRCKKFHCQALKLSLHGGIRCELYYTPPTFGKASQGFSLWFFAIFPTIHLISWPFQCGIYFSCSRCRNKITMIPCIPLMWDFGNDHVVGWAMSTFYWYIPCNLGIDWVWERGMGRGRQLKRRVQVHYFSCFSVIVSPLLAKAGAQVYSHIFPSFVLIVVCILVSFLFSFYACMYLCVLFCLLL